MMTENLIAKLIVDEPDCDISKQKLIPFNVHNVSVTVHKTQHDATIEFVIPEEQRHVVVCGAINRKRETGDLKDVSPMFYQRKRIKRVK